MSEITKRVIDFEIAETGKCLFSGCSDQVYVSVDAVTQSDLKNMKRSPRHCLVKQRRRKKEEEVPTSAKLIGDSVHKLIFEGEYYKNHIIQKPSNINRRTKTGKAEWDHFQEANKDKIILTEDEYIKVNNVRETLTANPILKELFSDGMSERSVFVRHPETNILLKGRLDYWKPKQNLVIDLKTTMDASDQVFTRDIFKYRYDIQAAFYTDLITLGTGKEPDYLIVAVEKNEPYGVKTFEVDRPSLGIARAKYREWLREYAACKESGHWPAYSNDVVIVETPDYLLRELF